VQPSPPLNIQAIQSTLATKSLGHRIELHTQVGSTNREAVALAQAGVEHGTIVLADAQTEGRGRLSRSWFSPPGINLYCSIILRQAIDSVRLSEWLSWLPLITALAAAEAIEAVASGHVVVKWPNDLLMAERKVGGILCESGTSRQSEPYQVIGIGLNVNGALTDFPPDIRDIATTLLYETGCSVDRNRLLSRLLCEIEACVEEFGTRGSERVALAYQRRCATVGKVIKAMLTEGKEFVGLAESIGRDGSLRVVQRPIPNDGHAPEIIHLRAADIIHMRT
jgi:BirA family transcriptional regulator, biotin operon repressor / biotin---[acetyl-CoA-carboxylase] ligase